MRSGDVCVQIPPFWIGLFNQCKFPYPFPVFYFFLPCDGTYHCFMDLIPDQCVDAVTLCESFHQVVFVLPDPLDKVRGNAGVQGSIAFAGHDIYARLIHVLNLLDRGLHPAAMTAQPTTTSKTSWITSLCLRRGGFNHAAMTTTWLCERTSPRSDYRIESLRHRPIRGPVG